VLLTLPTMTMLPPLDTTLSYSRRKSNMPVMLTPTMSRQCSRDIIVSGAMYRCYSSKNVKGQRILSSAAVAQHEETDQLQQSILPNLSTVSEHMPPLDQV
jgi:hypothetical protein